MREHRVELRFGVVIHEGNREFCDREAVGVVAQVEPLEVLEAAHEESGSGEQDNCECHLRRDERLPE